MPIFKNIRFACLTLFGFSLLALPAQETVSSGHFDLSITYNTSTHEWQTGIFDYDGNHFLPSDALIFTLLDNSRQSIPAGVPWQLIGSAGESAWLLPEVFASNKLYLGFGTQNMERGIFTGGLSNRGRIDIRLIEVSGSGVNAGGTATLWQAGFPPIVHYATGDGISEADALTNVPAGAHSHYNWAFSQPGDYVLTFQVSGELTETYGGGTTATTATYHFRVVDNQASLLGGEPLNAVWHLSSWFGAYSKAAYPWVFQLEQGWWYFAEADAASAWVYDLELGWLWVNQDLFPLLYMVREAGWLQYAADSSPRLFYRPDGTTLQAPLSQ